MNQRTQQSKFLSLILRHKPEEIGLTLDSSGWANISELLTKLKASGKELTLNDLYAIVETNNKQRFAISADGQQIRANQGHSIAVDLNLVAQTPPEYLLHGTAERFLTSILAHGLKKMQRHHVHLSEQMQTAMAVGERYGKPVILKVAARQMHLDGCLFYKTANQVWLTDKVSPDYLELIANDSPQDKL
ncbi:RNA 2'-phosphotransferase [Celerinatantimonas sp. MCCC 1A17872]|uniref:RNA 2'-phosphotransferase n=1 Tax=Celerinatantimonas sp. MCCC 1A17872 TaxID=3177514 RepID=UPI0038BFD0F8